ncbi:hypothetical protein L6R50_19920 [Myxococcota bacterium]|nr:hypothetical protein [Myxococcota bacterium]
MKARPAPAEDEARIVAPLLDDGRVIDWPRPEQESWLARLEGDLGLVSVRRTTFFLCVDPRDPESQVHAPDPDCRGRIPFDRDSAPSDPLRCDACGHEHWPRERPRTLYPRVIVSARLASAAALVERGVRAIDRRARPLGDAPAWRLALGRKETIACLLDGCLGTEFETDEFCRAHPVLHVVAARRLHADRMGGAPWIRALPLAELVVEGVEGLRRRLGELAGAAYPYAAAAGPARVHLPVRPEHAAALAAVRAAERAPGPAPWDEQYRVAGVAVVTSAQPRLIAIVRHLAAVRAEEVRRGRGAADYRWLSALDIAVALDDLVGPLRRGADNATNEETVDRYIRTVNRDAHDALAAAGREDALDGPLIESRTERDEEGTVRQYALSPRLA